MILLPLAFFVVAREEHCRRSFMRSASDDILDNIVMRIPQCGSDRAPLHLVVMFMYLGQIGDGR